MEYEGPTEKVVSADSRWPALRLRGTPLALQSHLSQCTSACATNGRRLDLEREKDFFDFVKARGWERNIPQMRLPRKVEARSFNATREGGREGGVPRAKKDACVYSVFGDAFLIQPLGVSGWSPLPWRHALGQPNGLIHSPCHPAIICLTEKHHISHL